MGPLYFRRIGTETNSMEFCRGFSPVIPSRACMMIAGLFLLWIGAASAQDPLLEQEIRVTGQRTTLYEALNVISQQAGCFFIYTSETVKNDKRVRLKPGHQPLRKVLDDLLADPGLDYRVMGRYILIRKKKPSVETPQPAQQPDTLQHILIRGHVYDRQNRAPIPYATVGIVEDNTGTVTNQDGFFLIRIPASGAGSMLTVSHLGYLSEKFPVRLLREQRVDIFLERRVISIQEVIIRYVDPEAVVEKALERRKLNYAVDPVYLTAFYREGVMKNHTCIGYSEAVFRVFKSPWDVGVLSDQVKLMKSRKIQNSDPRDTVFLKLKAGIQSALQLDLVKEVPDFLDLRAPSSYNYRYAGLTSYDAKDAYAIHFVQKEGIREALYTGTLYIGKDDFALLGADFEINPDYLELAAENLVLRKSPNLTVRLEKISYSVSYMPYNGRYYLRHVRCDIGLKTRLRRRMATDRFDTFLEFATCRIDTAGVVKFPRQEVLKPGVIFSDQPYTPDDDFWGNFNVIAPEAGLSEALSKIKGKIEEIR